MLNNICSQSVIYFFQIQLPFSSLRPIFRARTVLDAPPFDPSKILSLQACFHAYCSRSALWFFAKFLLMNAKLFQLMFSKFEYDGKLNPTFAEGAFQLPVSSIRAYIKDPITPRFNIPSHFAKISPYTHFCSLCAGNQVIFLSHVLLSLSFEVAPLVGLYMWALLESPDLRGQDLTLVNSLLLFAWTRNWASFSHSSWRFHTISMPAVLWNSDHELPKLEAFWVELDSCCDPIEWPVI